MFGILLTNLIIRGTISTGWVGSYFIFPEASDNRYFDDNTKLLQPAFFKVIMIEVVYSTIIYFIFLTLTYHKDFAKTNVLLKGIVLYFTFYFFLYSNLGSSCLYNPAMAFAMTCYQCGLVNGQTISWGGATEFDNGSTWAKFIWVYMLFPFVGSIFATLLFK